MRTIVRVREKEGLNTAKYYGKWSFERVLGVQEIVSCLASLANAAVHVWCLPELFRVVASRAKRRKDDANEEKKKKTPMGFFMVREWMRTNPRLDLERGVPRQRYSLDASDGLWRCEHRVFLWTVRRGGARRRTPEDKTLAFFILYFFLLRRRSLVVR
jgi:hypothetical protein